MSARMSVSIAEKEDVAADCFAEKRNAPETFTFAHALRARRLTKLRVTAFGETFLLTVIAIFA